MDAEHGQRWLTLTRATIVAELAGQPPPVPETRTPAQDICGGLFVSLHRGKQLRGCIGTFAPLSTVEETVMEMARAALRDPRFTGDPVSSGEVGKLTIELSLLSAARRTTDPLSLVPGRDGIRVRKGARAGCFLPQVATDLGWSAEEFLSACCKQKAGLPADAWKDPDTVVEIFTAERFSE